MVVEFNLIRQDFLIATGPAYDYHNARNTNVKKVGKEIIDIIANQNNKAQQNMSVSYGIHSTYSTFFANDHFWTNMFSFMWNRSTTHGCM